MEFNSEKYIMTFDKSEVSKCLLCLDPPCTKACPQHADVGGILKSLYFRNYIGAARKLACDCTYCNAPCEKACLHNDPKLPVDIQEIFMQVKRDTPVLPVSMIDEVDLSTDICGIKLENPFLLSSSVVASSYDMCRRAFESGWAGASFKTICSFPQHETSPRFSAIRHHSNAFCGFKNIEQLSDHSVEENMIIFEKLRKEAPKEIQIVGSPYLDDLDRKAKNFVADKKNSEDKVVLLAPSWGESSILSKFGDEMIDALVKTGYHIIVRPHPQSKIVEKEVLDPLLERYPESDQIEWDNNIDGFPSLSRADIMISDFSSVVFDFALIFNKPVIFADTDFDKSPYDAAWFDEDLWRLRVLDQMGVSLKQEDFPCMKELIKELTENDRFGEGREKLREQLWAKRGESAKSIADYLEEQLKVG